MTQPEQSDSFESRRKAELWEISTSWLRQAESHARVGDGKTLADDAQVEALIAIAWALLGINEELQDSRK